MPKVEESQKVDTSQYQRVDNGDARGIPAPPVLGSPSPMLRCPLPFRSAIGVQQFSGSGAPQAYIVTLPGTL